VAFRKLEETLLHRAHSISLVTSRPRQTKRPSGKGSRLIRWTRSWPSSVAIGTWIASWRNLASSASVMPRAASSDAARPIAAISG